MSKGTTCPRRLGVISSSLSPLRRGAGGTATADVRACSMYSEPSLNSGGKSVEISVTDCRLASTSSLSLAGLPIIDGVVVNDQDRVLVKDQGNPLENGVY